MEVKKCKDGATDIGEVIDDETYTLLLPKFLLGGDGYEMLKNVKADETADKNQNEIFIEYVKSLPTPITASDISNSNRITILGDSSVLTKSSDDSSSISHVVSRISKCSELISAKDKTKFFGNHFNAMPLTYILKQKQNANFTVHFNCFCF